MADRRLDCSAGHANAPQLAQALTAILRNALEHTPAGGTITLHASRQEQLLLIEISDSGIGIPADQLPHLFKPFFRGDQARGTKNGGSGLGLALAQRLITLHQGLIQVDSPPQIGTNFRILLPFSPTP